MSNAIPRAPICAGADIAARTPPCQSPLCGAWSRGTKRPRRCVDHGCAIAARLCSGRFIMKTIALGFAALLLGTAASHAAEAWKEAEVGGAKIYTDANGMTLYTFDKDEKGKSNCYDKCAANWPPLKAEAGA